MENKMSNEEVRMKMYKIGVDTRNARRKMVQTLELAGQGKKEEAAACLREADAAFEEAKKKHSWLKKEARLNDSLFEEQEGSIGFTEIFRDTIKRAAAQPSRSFGAIHFHVYS